METLIIWLQSFDNSYNMLCDALDTMLLLMKLS